MKKAPRGYTYEPCHGCGNSDVLPRPKNGVCKTCSDALKANAKRVAELGIGDDSPVAFYVQQAHYKLPYVKQYASDDDLQAAFYALLLAASESDDGRPYSASTEQVLKNPDYYCQDIIRLMRPSIANAIRRVFSIINANIEAAYVKGKSDGSNLLAMLAAGEMTSADFEERAGIVTKQ